MKKLQCLECGKLCGNKRGFDLHVAMHTRLAAKQQAMANGHKRHGRPLVDAPELSALDRVLNALALVTNGSGKLLEELRSQRSELMATVNQIDERIRQIEAIQGCAPIAVPVPLAEAIPQ